MQPDAGGRRQELDRPVIVRRPEAPRAAEEVVGEALLERRLQIGGLVAHDGDARRIDTEAQKRRREVRPIAIATVPAHELGPRGDDRRARYGRCQPVAVTILTAGPDVRTRTGLPRTSTRTFSGESICTHRR